MSYLLPAIGLLLTALPAHAHEVHATTQSQAVTVVTLVYANGKPFAYEQFEVTPVGAEVPSQVGRTDAGGRAAILPRPGQALEFTATSRDGHGTKLSLAPAAESAAAATPAETPRGLLLAAGGGLIFGLFGLFQLVVARNRSPRT
jgi:nickel transport protein